jgi:hypothetical protein
MLTVIPKTWSYTFSVMNGSEFVAQSVDLSWWRDTARFLVAPSDQEPSDLSPRPYGPPSP